MIVALTGGTGLVGRGVLRELIDHGHEVTALVRSEESAATVTEAGATAVVGDLGDHAWVTEQFVAADGAIHTASPGDASSADFDRGVAEAAVAAYAGTGKPYVHTGGVWVYGSGTDITEESPFDPPALTAWRQDVERELLAADLRASVVVPGVVYDGPGDGLAGLVATTAADGRVHLIGDGTQHWATVSSTQLAELYRLVLESDEASGYYIGVNEEHPTVREIAEAATGSSDLAPELDADADGALPGLLADALRLDQVARAARAHTLGWSPVGPSLVDVLKG